MLIGIIPSVSFGHDQHRVLNFNMKVIFFYFY